MENHVPATLLLLGVGADTRNIEGRKTPLTNAISEQRDEAVMLLLANGQEVTAYALVVAIASCALASRGTPALRGLLVGAAALVVAQVGVGIANVVLRLPPEVTGLHSGLAAALVLTLGLSLEESFRA